MYRKFIPLLMIVVLTACSGTAEEATPTTMEIALNANGLVFLRRQ